MSDDDEFTSELLTGDNKWWEFLDPQTYEVRADLPAPTRSTSVQLDWSRAKTATRGQPVGFSYFNHCEDCAQGMPPDFTFCVHCGGAPRSSSPLRTYTIVIAKLSDDRALEAGTELLTAAGNGLEPTEIERLFADLPVVFNVTARRDQTAALTAKMAEIGIAARGFSVDDPSVPWIRETAESLLRDTRKFGLTVAVVLAGMGLAWFVSPFWLLAAVGAMTALFVRELNWYRERYHLQLDVLLQNLTGFDPDTAAVARETLRLMSDREARGSVTVCLMEYYSLTQQFRAQGAIYGPVLQRTAEALEELMASVLVLAHRYAKLDDFLRANPPAALRQRLDELEARATTDRDAQAMNDAEAKSLTDQLASMQKMEATRGAFRERLAALARSMESMRTRFAAVRAQPSDDALRSLDFDAALKELDEEFEVFEETLAVVG